MLGTINLESEWCKYTLGKTYFLSINNYKLDIGTYRNLFSLHSVLLDFVNGKCKNSCPLFKVSFNTKYFYIRYVPTNRSIGFSRKDIYNLLRVIKAEIETKSTLKL